MHNDTVNSLRHAKQQPASVSVAQSAARARVGTEEHLRAEGSRELRRTHLVGQAGNEDAPKCERCRCVAAAGTATGAVAECGRRPETQSSQRLGLGGAAESYVDSIDGLRQLQQHRVVLRRCRHAAARNNNTTAIAATPCADLQLRRIRTPTTTDGT